MQLSHFKRFFLDLFARISQRLIQIAVHFYEVFAVSIELCAFLASNKSLTVEIDL
jgi:hypothetical protein